MAKGVRLADDAERRLLAVLSPPGAQQLKGTLQAVIAPRPQLTGEPRSSSVVTRPSASW